MKRGTLLSSECQGFALALRIERFPFVVGTVRSRRGSEPKNPPTAAFPASLAMIPASLAAFPASLGFGAFSPQAGPRTLKTKNLYPIQP